MVDPIRARHLAYRLMFLGLAAFFLFLRLLPLSAMPARVPGPDLLLALALLWVLRRPEQVPALMIAAVFLVEDLMTGRPPGLWAAIVLGGTEFLRAREQGLRDAHFMFEWMAAGLVILAMILVNHLVLALFVVPQATLGPEMLHGVMTIFAYPFLALALQMSIGLRRAAPGEVDAMGRRI
jgi:rod shape-determining protein MreD